MRAVDSGAQQQPSNRSGGGLLPGWQLLRESRAEDGSRKVKDHQLVAMVNIEAGGSGQQIDGGHLGETNGEQTPVAAKPPFKFAGVAASALASLSFSLSLLFVKLIPENTLAANAKTLAVRGLVVTVASAMGIYWRGSTFRVKRDELWVNVLRALFGTFSTYGVYCAMRYISLGDTTALVFSAPIWTSLLGRLILKEPLQWAQLVALPACILGIILIAHPALIINVHHPLNDASARRDLYEAINDGLTEAPKRWPGVVIALATSLTSSCTYIVLKFRKNTPILTCTFWLGVAMALISLLILPFAEGQVQPPTSLREWSLLLLNGLFSWLGQCIFQWAFLYESAGVVAVVRTLDVALTFALSALFLDESIYRTSIVGAVIIVLVVASYILTSWLQEFLRSLRNEVVAASRGADVVGGERVKAPYTSFNNEQEQEE